MGDLIKVLRPNATDSSYNMSLVGAATIHAALSDDLDSSYVAALSPGANVHGQFSDIDLPPGAIIKSVLPILRVACVNTGGGVTRIMALFPEGQDYLTMYGTVPQDTIVTWTTPANVIGIIARFHPSGRLWSKADIQSLNLYFDNMGPNDLRFYEYYLYVYYNRRPVVLARSPYNAQILTTTTSPTFVWEWGDWDADSQEYWKLKVFSGNTEVADPDSETVRLVWESPVMTGSQTQYKIPFSLPNGQYRWAIKVSDQGSSQRWGVGQVLTNDESGFDTSVAGWTVTNGSIVRDTTQSFRGTASAKLTTTALGNTTITLNRYIPCDALEDIEYFGAFRPNTTLRTIQHGVEWFNSSNISLGTSLKSQLEASGFFTVSESYAQAPVGAVKFKPIVTVVGAAAGEIHWVDHLAYFLGTTAKRNWSQESFEINVAPPPAPTIVLSTDSINQRVKIEFSSLANWVEVQRSVDGGSTWEYVRDGLHVDDTSQIFDREAPRGKLLYYRTRAGRFVNPPSEVDVAMSAWVSSTITLASDGQFWIKHPFDSAMDMKLRTSFSAGDHFTTTSSEEQTAYAPSGTSDYVIVGSDIQGEILDKLPLVFYSDAEWQVFENIRNSRDPVLLQTPFGSPTNLVEFWIRIGRDRSSTFINKSGQAMGIGPGADQVRRVDITATQVKRPTISDTVPVGSGPIDGEWFAIPLVNGWVQSGSVVPSYMKDSRGIVHGRGVVTGGAGGTVVTTLPIGFRATYYNYFYWSVNNAAVLVPGGVINGGYDAASNPSSGKSVDFGHLHFLADS